LLVAGSIAFTTHCFAIRNQTKSPERKAASPKACRRLGMMHRFKDENPQLCTKQAIAEQKQG
jgi:hypothetical protein